jgi:uncharacterized protein (TIGR03086 family)
MDQLDTFRTALEQTGTIVRNVKPDQLTGPTPCEEWDVRGLLDHTIGIVMMFNDATQGKPYDKTIFERDLVGEDAGAAYDAALGALQESLEAPGLLEKNWTMPFGEIPGTFASSFATLEVSLHGWDVAKATGQDVDWDPGVTAAAFAVARMVPADQVRVPGVYGPEQTAPGEACEQDKLAAFLGRIV